MHSCWGLTIWVLLPSHKREDGLGIVIGLLFAGSTRILSVIRQFIDTSKITDGITARETQNSALAPGRGVTPVQSCPSFPSPVAELASLTYSLQPPRKPHLKVGVS